MRVHRKKRSIADNLSRTTLILEFRQPAKGYSDIRLLINLTLNLNPAHFLHFLPDNKSKSKKQNESRSWKSALHTHMEETQSDSARMVMPACTHARTHGLGDSALKCCWVWILGSSRPRGQRGGERRET